MKQVSQFIYEQFATVRGMERFGTITCLPQNVTKRITALFKVHINFEFYFLYWVFNNYLFIPGLVGKAFNARLATATDSLPVGICFIDFLVLKWKYDDDEQLAQFREAFSRATKHLIRSIIYSNIFMTNINITLYYIFITLYYIFRL